MRISKSSMLTASGFCLRDRMWPRNIFKLMLVLAFISYAWMLSLKYVFKLSIPTSARHPGFNGTIGQRYLLTTAATTTVLNLRQITRNKHQRKELPFHELNKCFQLENCLPGENKLCRLKSRTSNRFECSHIMYMNSLGGGRTGNQMFRLAALLGTASYHGYTAIITPTLSLSNWFKLPNLAHAAIDNRMVFRERGCCQYDENITLIPHTTNWTFGGYFQSWKYFEGAEHIIKSAFKIKDEYTNKARVFINQTCPADTQCICMHVRRGDFTYSSAQKNGYSLAPSEFMIRAMEHFKNKYTNVHFIVISDDKAWCKSKLASSDVTVSPFPEVGSDMALMVESDHVIVTSGSFGWWGAWLSGGDVVYWQGYPGNGTWLRKQTKSEDYYPPHWIGLT